MCNWFSVILFEIMPRIFYSSRASRPYTNATPGSTLNLVDLQEGYKDLGRDLEFFELFSNHEKYTADFYGLLLCDDKRLDQQQ